MIKWFRRWRTIGYRDLYDLHFGNQFHDGCQQQLDFAYDLAHHWHEVSSSGKDK